MENSRAKVSQLSEASELRAARMLRGDVAECSLRKLKRDCGDKSLEKSVQPVSLDHPWQTTNQTNLWTWARREGRGRMQARHPGSVPARLTHL